MTECKSSSNNSFCTCTYEPSSRKGMCCDCIQYHKGLGELPGCLFSESAERSYDRSIANFIRDQQKKG